MLLVQSLTHSFFIRICYPSGISSGRGLSAGKGGAHLRHNVQEEEPRLEEPSKASTVATPWLLSLKLKEKPVAPSLFHAYMYQHTVLCPMNMYTYMSTELF